MPNSDGKFPVYRKYIGIEVWFEILSENYFEELKRIGTNYSLTKVKATIFPEKQFIQDMIFCHEGRWEVVTQEIYLNEKYTLSNQS